MENVEELEQQLNRAKSNLRRVKSSIDKLDWYLTSFEAIRNKLDDPENWLEKNLDRSTDQRNKINTLYDEVKTTQENLKLKEQQLTEALVSVEQLLVTSEGYTEQSQTILNEVIAVKTSSITNEKLISNLLIQSQTHSDEIKTLLTNAKSEVEAITEFLQKFNDLKSHIEDPEKGFEMVIQIVDENLKQSNSLLKQIEITRNNSNKNFLEIETEKETIEWIRSEVSWLRADSQADREEIATLLNIVSDESFADSFNKRKKELSENADFWRWVYLCAVGALVIYLILVFRKSIFWSVVPWIEASIFRIALSSPIFFLLRFSWSEYGKNRNNEEKYAFKFATSSVFRNHIKFLLEEFWEDKKSDVLLTTQKIVDMLYTPTYSTSDKLSEVEKKILSNFLKSLNDSKGKKDDTINIDGILDNAKKLKEVVWADHDLMKSVIPLIFKS